MTRFKSLYILFIALLTIAFSGGGQCLSASEFFLCHYCKTHTSEVGCTMMKPAAAMHSSTHSLGDKAHSDATVCHMEFDNSKFFIPSESSISDTFFLAVVDYLKAPSVKQIGAKQIPHPPPLIHRLTSLYIFNCSYLI